MKHNYEIACILIAFSLLLTVACCFLVDTARALPNSSQNGTYVIVEPEVIINQSPFAEFSINSSVIPNQSTFFTAYKNNTRIEQGQCVEVGGVYDVSGVIGFSTNSQYNAFAYYGRYEDAFDPTNENSLDVKADYIYLLPNSRASYYQFYMDPEIFGKRQGYWYQYTGGYERAANKRAFFVSDRCVRPVNETVTNIVENNSTLLVPKEIVTRHVSDILVSNDDNLYLNETGQMKAWIFGTTKMEVGNKIYAAEKFPILNSSVLSKLYSGSFSLVLENPGADGMYSVDYQKENRNISQKEALVPALRSIPIADITGIQPMLVLPMLEDILKQSDDKYKILKMEVQNPYVEISGYQEIRYDNLGLLEITGYTNKVEGTPITVYIDRENITQKSVLYPSMTTLTEKGAIGDYRTFHGYFPMYYDQLAKGEHRLTAVLPGGEKSEVSFYVREELTQHYQQPTYYKFIDGDPFYEPVIVEKEVIREVPVIKEVIVKEPVNYTTLAEKQNEIIYNDIRNSIPKVILGIVGLFAGAYLVSLPIRAYRRRTQKTMEEKP